MAKHPRLWLRGNRYWFRAKVPANLREHLRPTTEHTYSLRTSDPREALEKVRVESVKFDQEMAEARRRQKATPQTTLSDTEIDRLAAIHFSQVLEEDEEYRTEGLSERDYRKLSETLAIVEAGSRHHLARGDISLVDFDVDELLTANSIAVGKDSPEYRKLSYAILKASVRANDAMKRRHAGEAVDTPPPPPSAAAATANGVTLGALIEAYAADPSRDRSQKTRDGYRIIFDLLAEIIGKDTPARSIARTDCERVRDVLMGLPTNAKKRLPGATLEDAAKIAKDQGL